MNAVAQADMSATTETLAPVEDEAPVEAKAPAREIVRGRMPVTVVYLARYGAQSTKSTKEKAIAFGTTVGKIDDIAKGRNFGYVTQDFRPTEQQKTDALEWMKRIPGGASEELLAELAALKVASPEQAAAFEATRSASRGQTPTTKDGEPADAGGGNRRSAPAGKGTGKGKNADASDESPAAVAATAEALLI